METRTKQNNYNNSVVQLVTPVHKKRREFGGRGFESHLCLLAFLTVASHLLLRAVGLIPTRCYRDSGVCTYTGYRI